MPGWVLYGVLYLLFTGVVLWLATEALIQHGAPVLFRLLALAGFCGLWAGIVLKRNELIVGGLVLFVIAQAVVSVFVRKGEHRAWALGGGKGRRGRRDGAARAPSVRSDGVFGGDSAQADPAQVDPAQGDPAQASPAQFGPAALPDEFDTAFGIPAASDMARPAGPPSGAEFDTQVGIGFGSGYQSAPPAAFGVPPVAAHAGARPAAEAPMEPVETPVISPFVDDAYAQEIAEEYASGDAMGFAGATDQTAQFPRQFTGEPTAPYAGGYQQPGPGYPRVDPPEAAMPGGVGRGGGQPGHGAGASWEQPAAEGSWLDSYVSPREAAARQAAGQSPPGSGGPDGHRGPSVWDTYERRVRLPDAGPADADRPSQAAFEQPAFDQPAFDQPAFDQPDHGQFPDGQHLGGQFQGGQFQGGQPAFQQPDDDGRGPGGGDPAPWARPPEAPQRGPAVPRQPAPPAGSGSWRERPVGSSETLIGQIVSDDDSSLTDQWAQEPDPTFGDRPYPQAPLVAPASFEPPVPTEATGWDDQGGQEGFAEEPPVGGARPGAGRHGRGKRRGRR